MSFHPKIKNKIIAIIIAIGAIVLAIYFFRPTDSAQLLVISSVTHNSEVNNIGDIVGVFDGAHQFSLNELESFAVIRVNGITKEQAETEMNKLLPSFASEKRSDRITYPMFQFNISDIADKKISESQFLSKIKTNVQLK
ncbi:hypothetical protein KAK05_03365 [Candidatus Parcubacteria bacterium]|nr:hypothetical protein [Candidatus Parcubacteria bacterium]